MLVCINNQWNCLIYIIHKIRKIHVKYNTKKFKLLILYLYTFLLFFQLEFHVDTFFDTVAFATLF